MKKYHCRIFGANVLKLDSLQNIRLLALTFKHDLVMDSFMSAFTFFLFFLPK